MKTPALLLFVLIPGAVFAQQDPQPSAASTAYRQYRMQDTPPPFGLAKVQKLVAKIKPGNDDSDNGALSARVYNSLSTSEKFTYTMIHAENMDQNCDAMMAFVGEESKIFGHPLNGFDDQGQWSARQQAFLKGHRSSVISYLRTTMKERNRVGANLKQAILQIEAWELIPDVLAVFKKNRKDLDIISTCMVLMKDGKYKPFTSSVTYKKLYGNPDTSWQAFVVGNKANQDLEMQRATGFYNSKK